MADTIYTITPTLLHCKVKPGVENPTTIETTATLEYVADAGYSLPSSVSVTGATGSWDNTTGVLSLSEPTADVTFSITGTANTYDIDTDLYNCTAAQGNPTTITTGTPTQLVFNANSGYPFNAFGVSVDGATYTIALSNENKTITITLDNPTKDVSVAVEAKINSTLNQYYVVVNGQLYCVFNNRNVSKWDKRWIRKDMI